MRPHILGSAVQGTITSGFRRQSEEEQRIHPAGGPHMQEPDGALLRLVIEIRPAGQCQHGHVEHGPVEALGQLQRLPLRATEAEVFHKKKNVYSGHSSGAPVSRCRKTRRAFPLPLGRGMRDMTGKEYFSCKITQLLVAYRQKRPKRQGLSPRTASRPALPKRPPLE